MQQFTLYINMVQDLINCIVQCLHNFHIPQETSKLYNARQAPGPMLGHVEPLQQPVECAGGDECRPCLGCIAA